MKQQGLVLYNVYQKGNEIQMENTMSFFNIDWRVPELFGFHSGCAGSYK
jgi:hypothetical protein